MALTSGVAEGVGERVGEGVLAGVAVGLGVEVGGALASWAAGALSAAVASPSTLEHPANRVIDRIMTPRETRIIELTIVLRLQARYDGEYVSTLARNCVAEVARR